MRPTIERLLTLRFSGMTSLNFLSPDSKCHSFDHRANGYARGEGTAVVILKPLADALKDDDVIRAVIRGTGVNQDGKTPGITLPSAEAQEELIRTTYRTAGLSFEDTSYFEAHGVCWIFPPFLCLVLWICWLDCLLTPRSYNRPALLLEILSKCQLLEQLLVKHVTMISRCLLARSRQTLVIWRELVVLRG